MEAMGALNYVKRLSLTITTLYRYNIKFALGFTIVVILAILGFIVSFFSPYDTTAMYVVPKDLPPSSHYILGTTSIGRDVFWELTASIRNSLIIALITALIASHVGLLLGLIAGIRGGIIDRIIMFFSDVFIAVPGFILLLILIYVLKPFLTLSLMGIIISLVSWPWPARQVRSMTLQLRERTFIITSIFSGNNIGRILINEFLPYLVGWHLVNFTNTILFSIGTESALAIFGASILSSNTLGVMIYWALAYFALPRGIWWWITFPVIALVLIFVSFYLVSISLSEYIQRSIK